MSPDLIHNRGRGPELIGTRITVYNLLPYFLDPSVTEAEIARNYDLTPEQIAAARAFVLNNADSVLAEHLRIEERLAQGNPPEVREQAERAKQTMLRFRDWLAERDSAGASEENTAQQPPVPFPSFRDWLSQETKP